MIQLFWTPRGYIAQDFEAPFSSLYTWGRSRAVAAALLEYDRSRWIQAFERRRAQQPASIQPTDQPGLTLER